MKKYISQKNVLNLMQESSLLESILTQASQMEKRNAHLQSLLPPPINKNCCLANYIDGKLLIAVPSPAWKHKLRFLLEDLKIALKKHTQWRNLQIIQVIVQLPTQKLIVKPSHQVNQVSDKTIESLKQSVDSIENKDLKEALKQLAKSLALPKDRHSE